MDLVIVSQQLSKSLLIREFCAPKNFFLEGVVGPISNNRMYGERKNERTDQLRQCLSDASGAKDRFGNLGHFYYIDQELFPTLTLLKLSDVNLVLYKNLDASFFAESLLIADFLCNRFKFNKQWRDIEFTYDAADRYISVDEMTRYEIQRLKYINIFALKYTTYKNIGPRIVRLLEDYDKNFLNNTSELKGKFGSSFLATRVMRQIFEGT